MCGRSRAERLPLTLWATPGTGDRSISLRPSATGTLSKCSGCADRTCQFRHSASDSPAGYARARPMTLRGQVPAGTPAAREGFDMRRHGWTLCLGALLSGSVAAQSPTSNERFPPAPDLPGEVVSQVPGAPPPAKAADSKDVNPTASPLPDALLAPVTPPPAPIVPVGPSALTVPGAPASCARPAKSGCNIGFWEIADWLCFQSKSRQSAHFVTPYRPPLQAWFECEPRKAPYGIIPASCGTGPVLPAPVGHHPLPAPTPVGPISPEPPLAGGTPIGKCLDAEVLTSFQPVAPGLGFVPGATPMANPTTQVKPTSFKPK